ncbi:sugar transferase [Planomicrobium sp. YIM 101495]|nr:sugar transferase [Planomicrobium sp. YIM 101495]
MKQFRYDHSNTGKKVVILLTISAPKKEEQILTQEVKYPVKSIVDPNSTRRYLAAKRTLDIVSALIGLIVLMPIFLIVGICIKLEDPKGSVFFQQQRVGKDGERFDMFKFRSMVCNAEELKACLIQKNEASGPVFKMRHDPRVTRVGSFIRRTSIDEFPQLINVLKGQMSLVGPRPALPDEVAQYTLYERQRIFVVPGLTCYWQVSGRGMVSFAEWVEMDLSYIRDRTFWLDVSLILRTVLVLFGSKNAY